MDISYILMAWGFGHLVVVLDWHSRKVLSWRVSITMDTAFCLEALDEAVARFEREAVVAARIENPHVVSATDFGTLEEGEYYHADLIGLEAFEGEESIGKVVEVVDYPSAECLKIERPGGFLEVPMLPRWLDRVDIEGGKVHLKDLDDIPLQKPR